MPQHNLREIQGDFPFFISDLKKAGISIAHSYDGKVKNSANLDILIIREEF